ncbi:MAG: hypothetical protein GX153_10605 [Clostridiaceae bacterium]|nr:hypothetical protein [Clostridiaceae bacterium]
MGIKILYGTSQPALLDACVAQIDEACRLWPDRRAMLLVPEQTKAEAERLYFDRTGRSGILLAEVLSFSRLAWRVQGEIGGLSRSCVDPVGKSILLHALLKEHRSALLALATGAGRPGFAPQVGQVLGDLRRHGVRSGPLREASGEALDDDRAFAGKTADLAFLMEQYDIRMASLGLYDREDDLWRLAKTLESLRDALDRRREACGTVQWPLSRAAFLADTEVWVAGFAQTREFTPQEHAVLAGLAGVCGQVTVTVCADAVPGDPAAVSAGPDAFRIGRQSARRLVERFPGTAASRIPSSLPGVFGRIGQALADGMPVSTDVDSGSAVDPVEREGDLPADRSSVTTALFRNRDEEIRWVAGEIRRLTQLHGYRYADIAIGVSSPSSYLSPLRAVFREYGLSPFIDEPRPLSGTPLYRFLRGLLDLKTHDWSLPSVTACLRSGFCRIDRGEADRLENFFLARGLTGSDRVFDDRRYRAAYETLVTLPDREEESEPEPDETQEARHSRQTSGAVAAAEALELRNRVLTPLRDFLDELVRIPSCAGKCAHLEKFLDAYGVPEAVTARVDALHGTGDDEAAITLVRAWNGFGHVMEQMKAIAGDGDYDLDAFRDALSAGMESAQSGAIPPVIDRITVSGYTRAGFRRARVLFLIGATDEAFPSAAPPEGLLKDPDRERISRRLGVRLPSVLRDQVFADAALAHALLTAPSDALYMTAPAGTGPASVYLDLVRETVPGGRHLSPVLVEEDDPRLAAPRPARRHVLSVAAGMVLPADGIRLTKLRALSDTLERPGGVGVGMDWPGVSSDFSTSTRLPVALVREATGKRFLMSVSQLEKYASCPYAYLARYLLKLQERDVWSPRAADTGSVLHGVLELGIRALAEELSRAASEEERSAVLARWAEMDYDAYALACMTTVAERDGYGLFFDAGIRASSGRRVLRMGAATLRAAVEQLSDGQAVPVCTEWRFGENGQSPLRLRVQGTDVLFRGVVDRVDSMGGAQENLFRVVDYKSGDVRFDPDKVYYGLSLQLPAYAAAWRNAHAGAEACELAYLRFQAPTANRKPHESDIDTQAVRQEIAGQFRLRQTGLGVGDIALVTAHTVGRMESLCKALLSGKADALPARIGSKPAACVYCEYRAVCGHTGKAFFHMKPLSDRIPPAEARTRMQKLLVAIRGGNPEEA